MTCWQTGCQESNNHQAVWALSHAAFTDMYTHMYIASLFFFQVDIEIFNIKRITED